MDDNQKRFNIYVFFSTFARNLVEFFIGTILYKAGFSVHEVIFYYMLVQLFATLIAYPTILFSKRFDNRIISFVSIGAFITVQVLLNVIHQNYLYLIILAFFYALYRICYWMPRRYYNLKVMKKEKIASSYSIISIVNQVSIIVSSYIGSLFLDFVSIKVLTIISMFIFILSVIGLYKLKFEHEKNDEKIDVLSTLKAIPKSNWYLFASYEVSALLKFIVPMYIFIYISNNYSTIGLLSLISNIATIVITYIYGKCIDKDKNYYRSCILFVVLILILKVNVGVKLLFIVSFIEGILMKMYELSIYKELYVESKKFEYYNFNVAYSLVLNSFRFIVMLFIYLFVSDLKIMVYVICIVLLIGALLRFKEIKKSEYSVNKRTSC